MRVIPAQDDPAGATPGNDAVRERFAALYAQLSGMARRELGRGPRTSLDTVALVHEAFLKLDGHALDASEQGRFMALAGKVMRQVIVDHVRRRQAVKRGGDLIRVTLLTQQPMPDAPDQLDFLQIEDALHELAKLEPRLVQVVECRFFAGMEVTEIAALLQVSERTVHREWTRARAFLLGRLQ